MAFTKVHAQTHLLMAAEGARAPNIEHLQNDTLAETKKWKHPDAHEGVLKKGVPASNQTWLAGKYRMYSWFSYENFIYNQPAMLDFHIFHIKTSIYRGFSHENPEFRNGCFPFKPPSITRGYDPSISAANHPRCPFRQWTGIGLGPFWKKHDSPGWEILSKMVLYWGMSWKSTIKDGFAIAMFDYRMCIREEDKTVHISRRDISW